MLRLIPISPDLFAPFGEVIDAGITLGRSDYVASVGNRRSQARANLATVRLAPTPLPATITQMEQHAYSTQAFVPLDVERYVVIVAPDLDGKPDATAAIGFFVPAGIGISYRAGVWHTGMMVLDRTATFAILVHEDGTADDCTFCAVEPFQIDAESLSASV